MNSTAIPISRCSSSSSARICAWIVTSSAVVGSSAIRASAGTQAPSRSSRAGAARPRAGADRHRSVAADRGCRCARAARPRARAPASCAAPRAARAPRRSGRRLVYSGLSAVIGSWKIIAISRRGCRASRARSCAIRSCAVEADRAGRRRVVDQPQHRQRGDRLARARLADERELLARARCENDTSSTTRATSPKATLRCSTASKRRIRLSMLMTCACRRHRAARRR